MDSVRIALYTCNIGEYREEQIHALGLNPACKDPSIDYYYFTDDQEIRSSSLWDVQYCDPTQFSQSYDPAWGSLSRWIAKCVKWKPPPVLKNYDILVYIDCKCIPESLKHVTRHLVERCLEAYPDRALFMVGHPIRTNMQEEVQKIISTTHIDIENMENAKRFLRDNFHFTSPFRLCDTCFRIQRMDVPWVEPLLSNIITLLKTHGLQRDQLVINYAFKDAPLGYIPVILPTHWDIVQSIYAPYRLVNEAME